MKQKLYHLAIRRLFHKGMTDQEIAEHLWDLSDDAIRSLESTSWNRDSIPAALACEAGDTTWTSRRVQHFRLTSDPPLVSERPDIAILNEARQLRRDTHAYCHGWGNYVGRSQEIRAGLSDWLTPSEISEGLGVGWTADLVERWCQEPWDSLTPAEVAILDRLETQGPSERGGLPSALRRFSQRTSLGVLLGKGLVMRLGRVAYRGPLLYALASGVSRHRPVDHHHLTGPDQLIRRLALQE